MSVIGLSAAATTAKPKPMLDAATQAGRLRAAQSQLEDEHKCYTIGPEDHPLPYLKHVVQNPNKYACISHAIPAKALRPGGHTLRFADSAFGKAHEEIAHMLAYIYTEVNRRAVNKRNKPGTDAAEQMQEAREGRSLPDATVVMEVGMKPKADNTATDPIDEVEVVPVAVAAAAASSSSSAEAVSATSLSARLAAMTDEMQTEEDTVPGLERVIRKKPAAGIANVTTLDSDLMDVLRIRVFFKDPNRPHTRDQVDHVPEDDEPGEIGEIMDEYFKKLARDEEKEQKTKKTTTTNQTRPVRYKTPFYRIKSLDRLIELCSLYTGDSQFKTQRNEIASLPLDHASNPMNLLQVFGEANCVGLSSRHILPSQQVVSPFGTFPEPRVVWRLSDYSSQNMPNYILPFFDLEVFEDETALREFRSAMMNNTPEFTARQIWKKRMNSGKVYPPGEDLNYITRAIFAALTGPAGCDMRMCTSHAQQAAALREYAKLEARGDELITEHLKSASHLVKTNVHVRMKQDALVTFDELRTANLQHRTDIERKSRVRYGELLREYKQTYQTDETPLLYSDEHDEMLKKVHLYRCNLLHDFRRKAFADFARILDGAGDLSTYSEKIRQYHVQYLKDNNNFYLPRHRLWTDLGSFGEWMGGWKLELEYAHRFGHTHDTFILLFLSSMHIYTGDAFQPHTFLYGGKATGKSHSALMLYAHLIPGTVDSFVYTSQKAEAATGNRNDGIEIYEETPPSFLGNTTGGKGTGEMENMIKSRLTSGRVVAKVLEIDPITHQRRTEVYIGQCNSMMILCSNDGLDMVSDPMQSRLFKKHAVNHPGFNEQILMKSMRATYGEGFYQYAAATIRRTRRNHVLYWLIFKLIYTATLMEVDTRLGEHYLFSALGEASRAGLNDSSDVRNFQRLRMILKTTTVGDAIDRFFDLDPNNRAEAKFELTDLMNIEPYLCVNTEITVFALTLCSFQYEEPVARMVRLAIRKKWFPNFSNTSEENDEYTHHVTLPGVEQWKVNGSEMSCVHQERTVAWKPLIQARWKGKRDDTLAGALAELNDNRGGRYQRKQPSDDKDSIGAFARKVHHEIGGKAEFKDVCHAIRSLMHKTNAVPTEYQLDGCDKTVEALQIKDDYIVCSRAWIFAPTDTSPIQRALEDTLAHPFAEPFKTYICGTSEEYAPHTWSLIKVSRKGNPDTDMQEIHNPFTIPRVHQNTIARLHGRLDADDYDSTLHTFDVRNIADAAATWKMDTSYDEFFIKLFLKNAGWTLKMITDRALPFVSPARSAAFWDVYFRKNPRARPTTTYEKDMKIHSEKVALLPEQSYELPKAKAMQIWYRCDLCGNETNREFDCNQTAACKRRNIERLRHVMKERADEKMRKVHATQLELELKQKRDAEAFDAACADAADLDGLPQKRQRVEAGSDGVEVITPGASASSAVAAASSSSSVAAATGSRPRSVIPAAGALPPLRTESVPEAPFKLTRFGGLTDAAQRAEHQKLYMLARGENWASLFFDDCPLW